jgi:hypothetical protein
VVMSLLTGMTMLLCFSIELFYPFMFSAADKIVLEGKCWSEREDLNLRLHGSEPYFYGLRKKKPYSTSLGAGASGFFSIRILNFLLLRLSC